MSGKQKALLIDLDRCVGCHACTIACAMEHGDPPGVHRLRIIAVVGGPPANASGPRPDAWCWYEPRMCQHCQDPPCVAACPFDALVKREDGVVLVIDENCPGCQACIPACPYGGIAWDPDKNLVFTCDLCHRRVERGEIPACVQCCPMDAIMFGDGADQQSPIALRKKAARKRPLALAGEGDTGGRPSTLYVARRQRVVLSPRYQVRKGDAENAPAAGPLP